MNKELERLKNKNLPCANCKALQVLEIIKEKRVDTYYLDYFLIENSLKVLEIIKEKKVDVPYIIENPEEKNVIWYNSRFTGVLGEGWRMLTQEEYDLLKENLL